ncbi:hypothetical protein DERF_013174 [Dermatophagoides farinae]|uniref:SAM domain-containing protein n=1 Tax=Dermatophagoides farinae TaxID=6954 RepID=A0A922HNZ3_DERFA|nr:hypothetical protein DERF_013174 [Dermatophagoides farinae]
MPIKKKGRKQILQFDVIKKVTAMNLEEKRATIENIQEELSKKITFAKIIKQRPTVVRDLLSIAIAEGKIYSLKLENDDVIEYRTPRMIRDEHLQSIIMYDGQIPGTSYFNILRHCFTFERDNNRLHPNRSDGFTIIEAHEHSKMVRKHYLNYSLQIFKDQLIPAAIKNGHIERIKSSTNGQIKYCTTHSFRDTYDLYRRNRKQALSSIGEKDNDDDSQDADGDDVDDSIDERNEDESFDITFNESNDNVTNDSGNKSELFHIKKEPKQSSTSLKMKISRNTINRSPEIKSKKTLGPDFLDSFADVSMNHQKPLSRLSASKLASLTQEQQPSSSTTTIEHNNDGSQPLQTSSQSQKKKRPLVWRMENVFRSYINTKNGTIRMICSICRPECICFMCNKHERDPEMYVQCVTCSTTYHAHCYREKAHLLCKKCRDQLIKVNISQTLSPTTDSQVDNESETTAAITNDSSPALSPNIIGDGHSDSKSQATTVRTSPKVTIASIKSRSLVQSTKSAPLINGNNGNGSGGKKFVKISIKNFQDKTKPVLASKSSATAMTPLASNDTVANGHVISAATVVKDSKKIKEEPMDIDQITISSVSTSASTLDKNSSSINIGSKISSPSTISTMTTETNIMTTTTTSLAKSSDGISNKLTTATTSRKRKQKDISSFEIWNKKPSQSICYNFQTWLDTELRYNCKRFGPDVDLGPLTSLPNIITEWTSENVHRFLATLGFNDEADMFLMKDINGLSLMLLTRHDFLNALSIKTGPAIRLLGIVNRLHEEL